MVHKVQVENFFSVAESQELDLRVPANSPHVAAFRESHGSPETRLPLVVGIYGPNASGKSTILRAITTVAWFVKSSFSLQPNTQIPFFNPFASSKWWGLPTKILIEFDARLTPDAAEAAVFRYELHIENEGAKFGRNVHYEALSYAPLKKFRCIFKRNLQEFEFGKEFGISASDSRVDSVRPNASVISTLAQLNHKFCSDLILALQGLQSNISGLDKTQFGLNYALGYYLQNPTYHQRLNRELSRLDLGLEEMKIVAGSAGPVATFVHPGLDCPILVGQESMGTRKFIEIFPLLQYVLDTGGLAVIDELDTDIHPLLFPELLRWFYDPKRNPNGGQLLFTAHNPVILDELEKEQIFFTEKSKANSTRLYAASDVRGLRRGPSLMKKYLSGELGAVPHVG